MGKKSKRSPYEVQTQRIDSFGNKLEPDNAPEKKKKDSKSTKQKSPERRERKESNREHIDSQIPSVDHFGKKIISEPDNSCKKETKDLKPSRKDKYNQIINNDETNSTEKNSKVKSQDSDEEYSSGKSQKRKSREEFSENVSYDDPEKYHYHKKDYKSKNNRQNLLRINNVKGNLFDAPDTSSLAHCVAEDLQMGAGIAVEFR